MFLNQTINLTTSGVCLYDSVYNPFTKNVAFICFYLDSFTCLEIFSSIVLLTHHISEQIYTNNIFRIKPYRQEIILKNVKKNMLAKKTNLVLLSQIRFKMFDYFFIFRNKSIDLFTVKVGKFIISINFGEESKKFFCNSLQYCKSTVGNIHVCGVEHIIPVNV